MISFFSIFCAKYFIPYNITEKTYVKRAYLSGVNMECNHTEFVAVLFIDEGSPKFDNLLSRFAEASTQFCQFGSFLYVYANQGRAFLKDYHLSSPSLALFRNGKVWLACSFPSTSNSLYFLLHQFFTQKVTTVNSLSGLLENLDNFQFSLITPASLLNLTMTLRYQVAPFIGVSDVIVASETLLQELNISSGCIGIYRQEDQVIDSIKPDFNSVFKGFLPTFRHLVSTDLRSAHILVAALIANETKPEYEQFLYEISQIFKDKFIFGYLPPDLHYAAEYATLMKFHHLPMFLVFSTYDRSFYKNDGFYPKDAPFDHDVYLSSTINYLNSILSGQIERYYHSEPIPTPEQLHEGVFSKFTKIVAGNTKRGHDLVEKIVGKTYPDWMNDTEHDLVTLYLRPDDPASESALEQLRIAADMLRPQLQRHPIRFGFIDTVYNSAPIVYPYYPILPALRVRPRSNTSKSYPYPHVFHASDLVRFIARFASEPFVPKCKLDEKNHEEFKVETARYIQQMAAWPTEDTNFLRSYFAKMFHELGVELNKIDTTAEDEADKEEFDITRIKAREAREKELALKQAQEGAKQKDLKDIVANGDKVIDTKFESHVEL